MNVPQSMYRAEPPYPFGKLVFKGGATQIALRTDAAQSELAIGTFDGPKRPTLTEHEGVVELKYPKVWPWHWGKMKSTVTMCESVPWTIELRGGVSRLDAELQRAELRGVEIAGGASDVALSLGRPAGICPVRIAGGVSDFVLKRPAGVGVRVRIKGGAIHLSLDTFEFQAVGGQLRWESHGFSEAESSYDLEIGGGASSIRVAFA